MIIGEQYKILAELGAGGMGIVYQAVDTMLEREVAIKKLRTEFTHSADVAERFRREAKIQARLNHPNLAHLYSFFKEDEVFYIVMEFVSGTPLSRLVPMPWQRALPIFGRVLEGLEYAHSLGVLHRDIKPDNIMVGAQGQVKLMDFGIAHVLGSSRQTRDKSIVGTLEYISPEQILGKEIGPWSDVYALGGLLFELIAGRLAFEVESEFALLHHHLEVVPPPLSSVAPPGVPAFLDEAVAKALAKVPADRFTSCKAMADFLRNGAPEVFTAANSAPHAIREDEVERSVRRIEALMNGGELDLAGRVLRQVTEDFPGQAKLTACAARLEEFRQVRSGAVKADQKSAYLSDILTKVGAMGDNATGALKLVEAALEKYPRVPALLIAQASLRQ